MKLILIMLSVLTLVLAEKSETCKTKACEKPDPVVTNDQDSKKTNIAPCGACNTLVKSFQFQVAKSDSSDFESVKRKTCSDVPRSPSQCKENLKKWTHHLEKWFQESNQTRQDLKEWLCVTIVQVCCLENHYGSECTPCSKVGENGKICSGNGKCKGSGTRKGSGACLCDPGTTGETCSECAHGHFLSYKDGDKTLCSPCHHSCTGDCSGPEPKKCFACKEGFIMHAEHGCQDIDECQASGGKVCETNQFCMNLEGGHRCMNCDKSCKKCLDQGNENCVECADGYKRSGEDRVCVKDKNKDKILTLENARYFTYGGLCIATVIIFQKSTVVAGMLGLVVAVYVSLAEYYLTTMDLDGDLKPTSRNIQLPVEALQNLMGGMGGQ